MSYTQPATGEHSVLRTPSIGPPMRFSPFDPLNDRVNRFQLDESGNFVVTILSLKTNREHAIPRFRVESLRVLHKTPSPYLNCAREFWLGQLAHYGHLMPGSEQKPEQAVIQFCQDVLHHSCGPRDEPGDLAVPPELLEQERHLKEERYKIQPGDESNQVESGQDDSDQDDSDQDELNYNHSSHKSQQLDQNQAIDRSRFRVQIAASHQGTPPTNATVASRYRTPPKRGGFLIPSSSIRADHHEQEPSVSPKIGRSRGIMQQAQAMVSEDERGNDSAIQYSDREASIEPDDITSKEAANTNQAREQDGDDRDEQHDERQDHAALGNLNTRTTKIFRDLVHRQISLPSWRLEPLQPQQIEYTRVSRHGVVNNRHTWSVVMPTISPTTFYGPRLNACANEHDATGEEDGAGNVAQSVEAGVQWTPLPTPTPTSTTATQASANRGLSRGREHARKVGGTIPSTTRRKFSIGMFKGMVNPDSIRANYPRDATPNTIHRLDLATNKSKRYYKSLLDIHEVQSLRSENTALKKKVREMQSRRLPPNAAAESCNRPSDHRNVFVNDNAGENVDLATNTSSATLNQDEETPISNNTRSAGRGVGFSNIYDSSCTALVDDAASSPTQTPQREVRLRDACERRRASTPTRQSDEHGNEVALPEYAIQTPPSDFATHKKMKEAWPRMSSALREETKARWKGYENATIGTPSDNTSFRPSFTPFSQLSSEFDKPLHTPHRDLSFVVPSLPVQARRSAGQYIGNIGDPIDVDMLRNEQRQGPIKKSKKRVLGCGTKERVKQDATVGTTLGSHSAAQDVMRTDRNPDSRSLRRQSITGAQPGTQSSNNFRSEAMEDEPVSRRLRMSEVEPSPPTDDLSSGAYMHAVSEVNSGRFRSANVATIYNEDFHRRDGNDTRATLGLAAEHDRKLPHYAAGLSRTTSHLGPSRPTQTVSSFPSRQSTLQAPPNLGCNSINPDVGTRTLLKTRRRPATSSRAPAGGVLNGVGIARTGVEVPSTTVERKALAPLSANVARHVGHDNITSEPTGHMNENLPSRERKRQKISSKTR